VEEEKDVSMSGKSENGLSMIIFGLAVCLLVPACRTYQETESDAGVAVRMERQCRARWDAVIASGSAFAPPPVGRVKMAD